MNLLQMLLAGQDGLSPDASPEEIQVVASKRSASGMTSNSDTAQNMEPNASRRKIPGEPAGGNRAGRFGVRGTLRDILGTLGDAFAAQAGDKPVYSGRRQQEREMDALGKDWTSDPMAAADRMANANPDTAQDMYKTNRTLDNKDEIAALNAQKLEALTAYRDELIKAKAEALRVKQEHDASVMELRKELETMKEAGRNKRDNPPPSPRSKSTVEYFEQIDAIPPEKRTKGQQAWYDKQVSTGKKSRLAPASGGTTAAEKPKSKWNVELSKN